MSVYYETAEVETYAVVKANFNANFNVHSDISDAETVENSSNECSKLTTQPPTHSRRENEYRPKCGDALRLGSKGRYSSFHLWMHGWVAGKAV